MDSKISAAEILGIRHPIIQGPFGGGLSTVALATAVSRMGGLGSFGAHVVEPARIGDLAAALRAETDGAFALNLWVSDHDEGGDSMTPAAFDHAYARFEHWYRELGVAKPAMPKRYHPCYEQQVEALLEARPPVFSFVFGVPERKILAHCRQRGIVTIGAATTVAEAEALATSGVDLIVATGAEAGGHRPSFLRPAEESLMGTFTLVQLVADRVKTPVIAAGGIADARGVHAAQALGASAAQVGTAFLACAESGADGRHREKLFSADARDTTLTRSFSGRLARGLRNRWSTEFEHAPGAILPFPVQSWFASGLRAAALAAGRDDLISLWGGQIAPNLKHRRAADVMEALLAD